mgnify:CR=1 FL=1
MAGVILVVAAIASGFALGNAADIDESKVERPSFNQEERAVVKTRSNINK